MEIKAPHYSDIYCCGRLITLFKMVNSCHTAWTFGLIKQYYVDNFTAFEFYVSSRDRQHGSAMIVEP